MKRWIIPLVSFDCPLLSSGPLQWSVSFWHHAARLSVCSQSLQHSEKQHHPHSKSTKIILMVVFCYTVNRQRWASKVKVKPICTLKIGFKCTFCNSSTVVGRLIKSAADLMFAFRWLTAESSILICKRTLKIYNFCEMPFSRKVCIPPW